MMGNFIKASSQLPNNRGDESVMHALQRVQYILVEIDVTTGHEENDRCSGCFH